MAARATDRPRVLVADTVGPERRRQIAARLPRRVDLEWVAHDPASGSIDLDDLRRRVDGAAALYFENPSYLGLLEGALDAVREVTAAAGCLLVAGVDPTSLGVVRDPGSYGADLACGELQPLGHHQTFGGTVAGFMSCRLDDALLAELPNIYIAAVPTVRPGEYDYFWGNFESTSYATRGSVRRRHRLRIDDGRDRRGRLPVADGAGRNGRARRCAAGPRAVPGRTPGGDPRGQHDADDRHPVQGARRRLLGQRSLAGGDQRRACSSAASSAGSRCRTTFRSSRGARCTA